MGNRYGKRALKALAAWGVVVAWSASMAMGAAKPVKVYLMAGQSNMVGPGSNRYVADKHPELMTPRKDVWCVSAGKVSGPLKPGYGGGETSFGLELTMGHVLGDAVDNPIVLFKTSTGGTTLHKDWRPPSTVKRAGGAVGPLYTRMIRRFHNMLANRDEALPHLKGRDIELAGFVWFQGENDCCAKDDSGKGFWTYYEENLTDLLADVRRELGVPTLPVLIVQINDSCWDGLPNRGGTLLRPMQQRVAERDANATWIKTCDLNSGYHYDSPSHIIIGQRAGKALLPFIKKTVPQKWTDTRAAGKRFFAQFSKGGSVDTSSCGKGLLGYWRFEEGKGAKTADASGRGVEGELKGEPVWVKGRLGAAAKLAGAQAIEFARFQETLNKDRRIENLSVAYWLRSNRYGSAYVGRSEGNPDYGYNRHNWFINTWGTRSGWNVGCHDNGGGAYGMACFDLSLNGIHGRGEQAIVVGDGFEWHHVVMIYDGSRKTMDMYIDGKTVNKDHVSVRRSLKGIGDENHIVPARGAKLTVGGKGTVAGQFDVIDELAMWDRPITVEEVNALYNNGHGAVITNIEAPKTPVRKR